MSQNFDQKNLPATSAATPAEKQLTAFQSITSFVEAQRMAGALASSSLVPREYQGRVDNCLVAIELAHRTGSSVLAVMQSVDMIHGKPSWKSTYIIAAINSCGRFSPLRFRLGDPEASQEIDYTYWEGEKPNRQKKNGKVKIQNRECIAYAVDRETGEVIEGPPVSILMAVNEGWYTRSDSKWKTMPDLMLRYRSATLFGRLYAPDILLGMQSDDEMKDVTPMREVEPSADNSAPSAVEKINSKLKSKKAAQTVIEAKAVETPAEVAPLPEVVPTGESDNAGEFF